MLSNFNPVRELWMDESFFNGGTVGTWVPLSNFVGPVTAVAVAGPGLAGPVTITFETAKEDPAAICSPLVASATPLQSGGFCDPVTATQIVVDPTLEPYLTDGQQICREVLQCTGAFVRAIINSADPAIQGVMFLGKAKRLDQV